MKTYTYSHRAAAITALNILDGINHHKHWNDLQPAWENAGMGFVEFCAWIADAADMSERMLECQVVQDFPGVYDYEVSYELGVWIRAHMLEHVDLPRKGEVGFVLKGLIDRFFKQGGRDGIA
jgi:hypothetical protein